MEEQLQQKLYNAIGFIRTIKNIAEKQKDQKIEIDAEVLRIILNIMEEIMEEISK